MSRPHTQFVTHTDASRSPLESTGVVAAYCSADGEQRHGRRKNRFLKVLTTHFLSPALMPQGRLYIFCWRRNRLMLPERGEQRENPIKHFF